MAMKSGSVVMPIELRDAIRELSSISRIEQHKVVEIITAHLMNLVSDLQTVQFPFTDEGKKTIAKIVESRLSNGDTH